MWSEEAMVNRADCFAYRKDSGHAIDGIVRFADGAGDRVFHRQERAIHVAITERGKRVGMRRMRYGSTPSAIQQLNRVFSVGAEPALKGDAVWPGDAHIRKMSSPRTGCHGAAK